MVKVYTYRPAKGPLAKVGDRCKLCERERNHTVAACDRCRAECEGSRRPNSRGGKACAAAHAAALALGWVEVRVREHRPRQRKAQTFVQLVCPTCQVKDAGPTPDPASSP